MKAIGTKNKGVSTRTSPPVRGGLRSGWFMVAVLVALVSCILGGAHLALKATREVRLASLERQMALHIQQKVAEMTVWFGTLNANVKDFTQWDPVRLFASEAAESKGRWENLARQRKFMISQFNNFVEKNELDAAALFLDERGPFLETGDRIPLAASMASDIRFVLENGETRVRPIRLDTHNDPIMDMLVPVFAPQYVEATGHKCVAVILISIDMSAKMRKINNIIGGLEGEFAMLLQYFSGTMRTLPTGSSASQALGPEWQPQSTEYGELLPVGTRTLPLARFNGEELLSRGLAVPGSPWFVMQAVPLSNFEASYSPYRTGVTAVSVVLSILVAAVLYLLWWRLLEKHDRMTAAELQTLYKTVNRQKQLLEGINASVDAGIVLCGSQGRILYANQSFAQMAGESPATVLEKNCNALLSASMALCLSETLPQILAKGEAQSCKVDLTIRGDLQHYLMSSKPYTATLGNGVEDTGVVFAFRNVTELLQLQERSSRMLTTTVQAFVRAVEAVDSYLHGHSRRITALSVALARHMQLPESEAILATAAQLSHLGMIRLPRELLSKAGAYTPAERLELQNHVPYALEALADVDFGMPVQRAIAHMYERLDGSGYPCKLKGNDICIEGRILGVTSAFCAMMRPRSYRKALSIKQSFEILRRNSEKYDPLVLHALGEFLATEKGEAFLVLFGSPHDGVTGLDAPAFGNTPDSGNEVPGPTH